MDPFATFSAIIAPLKAITILNVDHRGSFSSKNSKSFIQFIADIPSLEWQKRPFNLVSRNFISSNNSRVRL